MTYAIRSLNNKAGHQVGYEVYVIETGVVVAVFRNRDFGGVSFWRRARDAAYVKLTELA